MIPQGTKHDAPPVPQVPERMKRIPGVTRNDRRGMMYENRTHTNLSTVKNAGHEQPVKRNAEAHTLCTEWVMTKR